MEITYYNKLVRDKITDIIKEKGGKAKFEKLSKKDHEYQLKVKLREEILEYLKSGDIEELADIVEVIDAICNVKGISFDEFLMIKDKKKFEKGGFYEGIYLISSEN